MVEPLIHFHDPTCLYRRISEIADEVEVLEDREAELEARAEKAEAQLAGLRVRIHYAENVAELAASQRYEAEAELARLRAAGTFNEGIEAAVKTLSMEGSAHAYIDGEPFGDGTEDRIDLQREIASFAKAVALVRALRREGGS